MIKSKDDLKQYLEADRARFDNLPNLKDWILQNEKWYIYQFLSHLRYVEYYKNKLSLESSVRRFLLYMPFAWHWFRYKRLGAKLHFVIRPNTCGSGLMIYHIGDIIHVGDFVTIGRNCTLLPGVVFSAKRMGDHVTVGDNVRFGLGSRIFGTVNIGDNVIIGANAVITKDLPNNVVAVGVPAKIVKKSEEDA
ncbi:MAG: serine acetyltransferase [Bacteroidaceae bacterium]|nr:serine acetyltransferase [Bacteroidaceae bacterium]